MSKLVTLPGIPRNPHLVLHEGLQENDVQKVIVLKIDGDGAMSYDYSDGVTVMDISFAIHYMQYQLWHEMALDDGEE